MFSYADAVIVDMQFSVGNNSDLFIKELAVLPGNGVAPYYYLFKPPFAFAKLGKRAQYQNLYNLRHINNLDWYCGTMDYSRIQNILAVFRENTIIVKGKSKKDTLAKFLPNAIIEDLGENFSLSAMRNFIHNCPYHDSTFSKCSINNVFKIRTWMEKNSLFD